VTLRYPSDVRVFFPARPDLKPFLQPPNDPGTTTRTETDGLVTETLQLPIIPVRSGVAKTPRIEVPWHRVSDAGGAGESGTVEVPPLRADVRSQLVRAEDLEPAPLPAPRQLIEENTPLRVALFVLGMMALAAVLTLIGLRWARGRFGTEEPKPRIPPHVTALEQLEQLARSGRLDDDEARLVLGEINLILRTYLGGRYSVAARDMTSTELLDAMKSLPMRGVTHEALADFAETSDLVKFARMPASPDELRQQLSFVQRVVEQTMQSPAELEAERQRQLERIAEQKQLRVEVMAPAPLRLQAFGWDAVFGAFASFMVAWLAIDTERRGLFDAAYGLYFVWLCMRDTLGSGSPGKAIVGLRIALFESAEEMALRAEERRHVGGAWALGAARDASVGRRLQRNLLMLLPGAGVVAEGLTMLWLPELRRLGDHFGGTRVIDARYGERRRDARPGFGRGVALLVVAAALLVLPWIVLGGRPA
jgi:hypothetical protein